MRGEAGEAKRRAVQIISLLLYSTKYFVLYKYTTCGVCIFKSDQTVKRPQQAQDLKVAFSLFTQPLSYSLPFSFLEKYLA